MTALHLNPLAQLAKAMLEPSGYVSRGKLIAHVICGWARKIGHDHQKQGRIQGIRCYETPFSTVKEKALRTYGRTDGWTDGRTDGPTDGQTLL